MPHPLPSSPAAIAQAVKAAKDENRRLREIVVRLMLEREARRDYLAAHPDVPPPVSLT